MNENGAAVQDLGQRPEWYRASACRVEDLAAQITGGLGSMGLSFAAAVEKNVPVYRCENLAVALGDDAARPKLLAEWADVLLNRSGVLVLKGAYADTAVIDAASLVFEKIIAGERNKDVTGGDHFAEAGANDRVWNALEKLCMADPEVFARYFANEVIAAICQAWLGPNYQMTAQVNLVRPGGPAQRPHRDYHLGFATDEAAARYPSHVHLLSPMLTLQGAVAHCNMPVESGPTLVLPFSQLYRPGYVAWRRTDFQEYFDRHAVQLPLEKGDAMFFNPALFHAAGANTTTDIARMANLLQVSSAFGRSMEALDRRAMSVKLYPAIRALTQSRALTQEQSACAIAACAEGYSFPTDLDLDPPVDGLAPQSQQDVFHLALREDWSVAVFAEALAERARRGGGAKSPG